MGRFFFDYLVMLIFGSKFVIYERGVDCSIYYTKIDFIKDYRRVFMDSIKNIVKLTQVCRHRNKTVRRIILENNQNKITVMFVS
jgi:hypothetical protein